MKNEFAISVWRKSIQSFQKVSIGFDLFILISVVTLYDIAKASDIYFAAYFWSFLSFILRALAIVSIIYIFIQFKNIRWKAFVPLILNSLTIWILFSSSYVDNIWNARIRYELQLNKSKYEEIITKLENQELESPDEYGHIRLSSMIKDFIIVDKNSSTTSIFFDNGTSFHGYAGFMYRSDDATPPTTEFMNTFWFCEHQELYWYYCSSN